MKELVAELFINKLLKYNTHSDLSSLNGKHIAINLQDKYFTSIYFQNNYINILPYDDKNTDVSIFFSKKALFSLLKKKKNIKELINDESIKINGDIKSTQLLSDFLINLKIDWQIFLSDFDRGVSYQLKNFFSDMQIILNK